MKKYKVALIGYGFLSDIIAKAITEGPLNEFELVGVLGRTEEKVKDFAATYDCEPCNEIDELMALKPNYTIEASTPDGLKQYAEEILNAQSHLIVLSIGALADEVFYNKIERIGKENNKKIYLASGAVGGFDVLQTAGLMGKIKARMTSKKMPRALKKTRDYDPRLQHITEPKEVFFGTTREIMDFMPNGLNLSIATALASAGIDETEMRVIATPNFEGDEYKVEVQLDDEIWIELDVYSKTSAIAGWSVVTILKNIESTFVI